MKLGKRQDKTMNQSTIDKETLGKHRKVWSEMKQRCSNPNNVGYKNYGGRGITVCDEWKNSFAQFMEDMGPRPSDKHEIDRVDNNGNYEPSNCGWATKFEQQLNREISKNGGVRYNTRGNYWEAYMRLVYEKIHIGCYETEQEARIAREGARKIVDNLKKRGLFALDLKELLK